MNVVDNLLGNDQARNCLAKIWEEATTPQDQTSRHNPSVAPRFMRREYLNRLESEVIAFLPIPRVLVAEDFYQAMKDCMEDSPGSTPEWGHLRALITEKLRDEQRWEPFPVLRIAPGDDYKEFLGEFLWRADDGRLRIELCGVVGETLYVRAVGRASEAAMKDFSKQAEQSIVTALRTVDILDSYESELIDYSCMTEVSTWILHLPSFSDEADWPDLWPWVKDHLSLQFGRDEDGQRIANRLTRALKYLMASDLQRDCGPGFLLAMASAESLLCTRKESVMHQFRTRGAALLEPEPRRWKVAQKALRKLYNMRSDFVHGKKYGSAAGEWDRLIARALAGAVMRAVWLRATNVTEAFYERLDDCIGKRMQAVPEESPICRLWRNDSAGPSSLKRHQAKKGLTGTSDGNN